MGCKNTTIFHTDNRVFVNFFSKIIHGVFSCSKSNIFPNFAAQNSPFMKKTLLISALFIVAALTAAGQSKQQARLLRNAYRTHSESQLYKFFDNWSNEVQSNEKEANDLYVAEAHKVYAAFYQPLQLEMFGHRPDYYSYEDVPYFIVQGGLVEIGEVEYIPYKPEEIDSFLMVLIDRKFDDESERKEWKELLLDKKVTNMWRPSYDKLMGVFYVPETVIDSAVAFRPPVHFEGHKIVYLTEGYKRLLDSFLGGKYVPLGAHSIMQPAYAKGKSRSRQAFLSKAVRILHGHWGGYWHYETFPKANCIYFNPERNRAVVLYRFAYEGWEMILEKQDGVWVIVSNRLLWNE